MEPDEPGPPCFVKPRSSRRIPIINPESRTEFTIRIDQKRSQRERKAAGEGAASSLLLSAASPPTAKPRAEQMLAGPAGVASSSSTSTPVSTHVISSPEGGNVHMSLPPRPPSVRYPVVVSSSSVRAGPGVLGPAAPRPAASGGHIQKPRGYPVFKPPTEDDDGKDIEWAFDVYARPFVPEAFTRINRLDGVVVDTPPEKQINFGAYASSSLPDRFLPIIPKPMELPKGLSLDQQDLIDPRKYEQYFSYHIQEEVQAEGRENDKYALYGQEVTVTLQEHYPGSICLFTVPGLREETPRLYEDDIVQLRQLRYDSQGRFLGAAIGQNQFPTASKQEMIPWTGRIYNGRVTRVQLQQELLTVKVYGLDQQSLSLPPGVTAMGQSFSAMFNIQFMAPTERYLPMQHVLPVIQYALHEAITNSNYDNMGKNEVVGSVQHFWYQSMLFPIDTDCDIQENLHPGHFNSPFLDKQLNWEQKKAVQSVCQQNYGTLPYLISGPPGTGKTKTIIETTLQLLVNVKKVNHILLCAPSDPAADTLVDRLRKHLRPQDMLRLNRPTRTFEEIPAEVLPYCYTVSGMFCLPPFPDLMKYRVVVTTCRDAALLMYGRMTNTDLFAAEYGLRKTVHPFGLVEPVELHWSALLMDEAAQALEAEALIPISVVAPPQLCPHLVFMPLLVMAGDQCQLGPHTFLPKTPLKMSLFARLFSRSVYADHPMARGRKGQAPPPLSSGMLPILRPAFTNLIRNYRSHTAILAIPSALFYHDTLECEAPVAQQNTLVEWSGWKGKRWPVLFHSNPYRDDIEREGGGWYNTAEVEIAALYVKSLVGFGVAQKDICIMSPFKAQVRLLRRKMRDPRFGNYYDVNIGPTEAFQGLEKGVVILCTTRSKPRFVEKDIERDWGIVGLPNKMNVALTRAQYGLIIIGKRAVLKIDRNWAAVLAFCDRNGLTSGLEDADGHGEQDEAREAAVLAASNPEARVKTEDIPITRLEKQLLLAYGRGAANEARVLRGVAQMDEMWANSHGYDRLHPGDAEC